MTLKDAKDIELKEYMDRQQFVRLLHQWLDAAEGIQDLTVEVKGQTFHIPGEVFLNSKYRVEYEFKEGRFEYEMTMKWH